MTEVFDPEIHAVDKDGNPSMNKNGTFRKKRSDAGSAKLSSPRPSKASSSAQAKRYEEGVAGLLQIPAMALTFVNPVDGFVVAHHTPPISKAVADLAVERPEVAAALDKVLAVGPYGALIGAVLPLAVQLAHNHGMIPESMATAMGATPKRAIERHLNLVGSQTSPEQSERPEHTPESDDEPLTTERLVADAA